MGGRERCGSSIRPRTAGSSIPRAQYESAYAPTRVVQPSKHQHRHADTLSSLEGRHASSTSPGMMLRVGR